ncbi:MAG: radical SAM protein [Planctomycetes bacterium]|nr:radical SAM protein [Planctomycetota bacterium]
MRYKLFKTKKKNSLLLDQSSFLYEISESLYYGLSNGLTSIDSEYTKSDLEILRKCGYFPVDSNRFDSSLKSIALTLTHGCNMGCAYCCVGPNGLYKDSRFKKMDPLTALRSIDFLVENTTSRVLRISFFGGEPLMNWDIIIRCLEHSKRFTDKEWIYLLSTNGTLITDEISKTLAEYSVKTVITLDGPPHIHNKQRPFISGKPSFETVIRGIKLLKEYGALLHLKCIYTKDSPLSYDETTKYLHTLGFEDTAITVSFENNCKTDPQMKTLSEKVDLTNAKKDRDYILDGMAHKACGKLFRLVMLLLSGSRGKQQMMCTAGLESVEVSPDGDIYVCHLAEFTQSFKIGSVFTGLNGEFERIKELFTAPLEPCRYCWAYDLCEKPCNLARVEVTKNNSNSRIDQAFCDISMAIIKEAIEVILNMDDDIFKSLIQFCNPSDRQKMIQAYEFRSNLSQFLQHVKPCFILPVRRENTAISFMSIPA